jgi:hypothetical protein
MLSATGGLAEVLRNMIQLCGLANCRGEPGDDSTLNGPRASSEAIFFWQLKTAGVDQGLACSYDEVS